MIGDGVSEVDVLVPVPVYVYHIPSTNAISRPCAPWPEQQTQLVHLPRPTKQIQTGVPDFCLLCDTKAEVMVTSPSLHLESQSHRL